MTSTKERFEEKRHRGPNHGMSKSRIASIYSNMRTRCTNPNVLAFRNYGGRGIKCLWVSFLSFKEDMYESYLEHVAKYGEKNTEIDRINNNDNYYKENCRWVSRAENCLNRRNTLNLEDCEVCKVIKGLASQGCDYKEIMKKAKCGESTVYYHLSDHYKGKLYGRTHLSPDRRPYKWKKIKNKTH